MKHLLMFTIGALTGSVVTGVVLKKKYDEFRKQDIDSLTKMYESKKDTNNVVKVDDGESTETETPTQPVTETELAKEESAETDTIHKISEDEYELIPDYDSRDLILYNNDVLADDDDTPVDVEDQSIMFGHVITYKDFDNGEKFIYYRNDETESYYCIAINYEVPFAG